MKKGKKKEDVFHSPSQGPLSLAGVAAEVASFMSEQPQHHYQLIVGTDSEGTKQPNFVTAIIVYRVGKGGRYFWKRINNGVTYHDLRDRIYEEVDLSLRTAQDILEELKVTRLLGDKRFDYDFQIHIDVGDQGPTRDVIKGAVGIVQGNGFQAKIKPDSYGASHVADRYA